MPAIVVSSARFRSMLANRHWSVDEVADRITTDVDVRHLATQDQPVEFADLVTLGKLFKRPWSYLLSDDVERFPDLGQDNRTVANQRVPTSPDLLEEYVAAAALLTAADEFFPEDAYAIPPALITRETSPARAAEAIRSFLGVSIDEQLGTKDQFAALRLWVTSLHRRGIYVAQRRLKDETVRAFSKTEGDQAVIVVDTGDTPYARIFSALHEYCHVVLRTTGICDMDEHRDIEYYCNEVAARVLLPSELLDRELADGRFGVSPTSDDERLVQLSHHLRVSQAVLLIRLRTRGTISRETYEELEGRRRSRRSSTKSKGGGTYYATAINRVGRRFARNVFGAVDEGKIDRQDAGALLGVGEHSVDRFRTELVAGEAVAP